MKIFYSLLDAIFPPRCVFCGNIQEEQILCSKCDNMILECDKPLQEFSEYPDLDKAIVACETSPELRRTIHAFKYRLQKRVAQTLGNKLTVALQNHFPAKQLEKPLLISIPLHWSRRLWRGFNQAEILAQIVATQCSLELNTGVIKRHRYTRSQMKLKRVERLVNLRNAFSIIDRGQIVDRTIILVDDVVTTGTTLGECAQILKEMGAREVIGLVLSRGI